MVKAKALATQVIDIQNMDLDI